MSNLINFNFENHPVRVELKDGEPLFCLSDVAVILNLEKATPNRFNLDEDGVHKMSIIDSLNRIQEVNFISEPNLYRVIFRSNKKEAVKFQNWVFEEVLPSIRKTGSYEVAPAYPMVNIVNPPMPNGAEMYKTFIATVNMRGVMTMRELKKDEFVSTYEDLPDLLRYRSWYVPNEKNGKNRQSSTQQNHRRMGIRRRKMDRLTSDNISDIMSNVDKCKVLIELLEHKNGDNDWQLSQALSVIKDLLNPAILELIEISDYLWEKEQEQMQKQHNIPLKVA